VKPHTNISTQNALDGNFERPEGYVRGEGEEDGLDAAHSALEASLDKKALEPVVLDMRGLCSYTNYILIVSGRSDRQVDAIADGIRKMLREREYTILGSEGAASGQWALLDYGDLVVHIFHHPMREHYDLESLWVDAPRVPIEVPNEARATPEDSYTA
jgi:ribosome-associated protein